jgi:molybdenum cofactor cytidylyltransferase
MGEAKALLRLGNRTFLECAASALASGGCARVWVVTGDPATDPVQVAIGAEARGLGLEVVVNAMPDCEQIDSLRCGLRAMPVEAAAAVVLPVDVPHARTEATRALIDAFRRTAAPIVLPTTGGRHGHPVLFARDVWSELLGVDLPDGARTVIHGHHDLVEVQVPELPADVDTPDDYRRLLEETR